MAQAGRDQNRVTTLLGVSSDDGTTPVALYADPTTHRLLTSASGAAPTDATYVTLSTNATLTAERVLTGTANQITITDNGAGSTVVLSTPQNIAAASSPTFAGLTLTAFSGAVSAAAGVLSAGTLAVANGGTGVTASTGSVAVVLSNSPTLVTPVLGAATATSINGLTITSSTGTLTLTNAKTLSVTNSLTLSGTDSTTMTFPTTSATIARTDAGQTFTGVNVFTSPKIITQISDTNGNVLLNIGATGSAVNYVKVTNAATGTAGPILSADGETNVDLKIAGKGTGKVHHTTSIYDDITSYTPSAAGTATLTLQTSNTHFITMPAGNITIALSNEAVGQKFIIRILQDGTGSRTVTWFTTIKWAGGVAPTLTTTASKADTFGFIVTSAGNYDGYIIGQNV